MNLSHDPSIRTNGKHIAPKGRNDMTKTASQHNPVRGAHTATNLTDVRCPQCGFHIIEGDCLDSLTETPLIPVICNKKGEPYEVTWIDAYTAHVFHPGQLEFVKVECHWDALTCRGYSNGERCWQFPDKAHCLHTLAVERSINLGERPEPIVKPLPPMHVFTTPTEVLVGRATEMDLSDDPLVRLFVANGR